MITLYKNGDRKTVHEIDANAWIKNGWLNAPIKNVAASQESDNLVDSPQIPDSKTLLDINKATESELIKGLPGIGTAAAKKIIGDRLIKSIEQLKQLLPDKDWDELSKLFIIGEKTKG